MGGHAHRVDVVAGHDPVGRHHPDQSLDPIENGGCDHLVHSCGDAPWRHSEVQVPHRVLKVPGIGGGLRSGGVVGVGQVAAEALRSDPPAVAIGADQPQRLEVGKGDVAQRREVVALGGQAVVPHAQAGRKHGGDPRLVHRGEPSGFGVAGQERLDVPREPVDPAGAAEPGVVVGQPEVAEVDHRFQAVATTGGERPVPQGPVVHTGQRLGQAPRHAIAPHPHAQRRNVGQIGVHTVVVAAGRVLVDPDQLALVEDQRVRALFAEGDGEGRKVSVLARPDRWGLHLRVVP